MYVWPGPRMYPPSFAQDVNQALHFVRDVLRRAA